MRLLILFTLGIITALVLLPLTASMRERILQAWREFRAGWYGNTGYEMGGGGADNRVTQDDSELVMIIPGPSELHIRVDPLP